jgi:hypothetical protein
MADTFTKFDQLGSVLTELSFRAASLHMTRDEERAVSHFTAYLHGDGFAVSGMGDTPSEALTRALAEMAAKEADLVEAAAERVAA